METIKLNRCKFCGTEGKLRTEAIVTHTVYSKAYGYCPHCGFTMHTAIIDETHDGLFVFEAIDAWNEENIVHI